MKIRTKLFIFIPLLVLLLNVIAFLIFQSGKKVQESYDVMMQRIFYTNSYRWKRKKI